MLIDFIQSAIIKPNCFIYTNVTWRGTFDVNDFPSIIILCALVFDLVIYATTTTK